MNNSKGEAKPLTGVPETLLIPLWARASESGRSDPIVRDPKAVEMVQTIDYDFSRFEKATLSQLGVSVRTMILDRAVKEFLMRYPDSVIVNLGAGLDTRCERISHPHAIWYDLDVPEVIALRTVFFETDEFHRHIAKSVFDLSWIEDIANNKKPVMLIAEGLLMYFPADEVKPLLQTLVRKFSGAEMLLEILAPIMVGKAKYHDSVKTMGQKVDFLWGEKDSQILATWDKHIRIMNEWNYYDYCGKRWKFMGILGHLPIIRPQVSNRIVHLKFSSD